MHTWKYSDDYEAYFTEGTARIYYTFKKVTLISGQ